MTDSEHFDSTLGHRVEHLLQQRQTAIGMPPGIIQCIFRTMLDDTGAAMFVHRIP